MKIQVSEWAYQFFAIFVFQLFKAINTTTVMTSLNKSVVLLFVILLPINHNLFGQADILYQEIKQMDSLAFDAYNRRDIKDYSSYLASDIEFYHDQDGLIAPYNKLVDAFSILFRPDRPTHAVRRIVPNSIEVYPIDNVGAYQTGNHKFYELNPSDSTTRFESIAKMAALWKEVDGKWKMSRVLSYNHHAPTKYEQILDLLDRFNIPNIAVGVITDSAVVSDTYDRNGNKSYARNLYNIASMTKPLVVMTVLKLAESSKWDMNEPLSNYYVDPDVEESPYRDSLTSLHVVRHQTGFPNWRGDSSLNFEFPPGSAYGYSGEGFEYLRKALETKFDKPLQEIVGETLLIPLRMNNTFFVIDSSVDTTKIAKAYKGEMSQYELEYRKQANAADDVITSIDDYMKFIVYSIETIKNSQTLQNKMFESTYAIEGTDVKMGMGWFLMTDEDDNRLLFHSGVDKGVRSIALFSVDTNEGITILTNSDNSVLIWDEVTSVLLPELFTSMKLIEEAHKN